MPLSGPLFALPPVSLEISESSEHDPLHAVLERFHCLGLSTQPVERVGQRLYVHGDAKQEREDTILSTKHARFEASLRQLQERLSKPGYTRKYERVPERVGRTR